MPWLYVASSTCKLRVYNLINEVKSLHKESGLGVQKPLKTHTFEPVHTMNSKKSTLEINVESLEIGLAIVQELTYIKPYSSLSFKLRQEGFEAIKEVIQLTERKMGKNMYKLKKSALEFLNYLIEYPPGEPLNDSLQRRFEGVFYADLGYM